MMVPGEIFSLIISFCGNFSYRLVCRKWSLVMNECIPGKFFNGSIWASGIDIDYMKRIPNTDFVANFIERSKISKKRKGQFLLCMNDPKEDFNENRLPEYLKFDLDNYIKKFDISLSFLILNINIIIMYDSLKCFKYLRRIIDKKNFETVVTNAITSKVNLNILFYLFEECSDFFNPCRNHYEMIIRYGEESRVREILSKAKREHVQLLRIHFKNSRFECDKTIYKKYFDINHISHMNT